MMNSVIENFNEKYLAEYQKGEGHCNPTNPNHSFDTAETGVKCLTTPAQNRMLEKNEAKEMASTLLPDPVMVFGHPVVDFIHVMLPNGAPDGSRHKTALKLANDLMVLLDGNEKQVSDILFSLPWVQDVVAERGADEIDKIVEAAKKLLQKREAENLTYPQPSKDMKHAIEQVVGRKYTLLTKGVSNLRMSDDNIFHTLLRIGKELEKLSVHYPLLKQLCFRMDRKYYPAAFFVGGGFAMTLMTRCWYQFWPKPGKKCRLNSLVLLIGRMGGGKQIAVDLYRIMMKPIKDADAPQIAALNKWNQEREQNGGGSKNKTPRPTGILRSLPSETSTAALREAEANAHEVIDGEDLGLHVSIFDSELQNTLSQLKKGYMDAQLTYWLKCFHNEPHGAFLKTSNAPVGETDVHFNAVYTGTEDALKKLNTEGNFVNGLNSRFTAVPNADSNFEMMKVFDYDDAAKQHEADLLDWCYKLDSCKGNIPCALISKALKDWTERRMADAGENQDYAEEDLVKRPCWHAINFALPFIITRHWDQMVKDADGHYMCGPNFMVDKTDVKLAILIANTQLAFQEYFFKAVGERHYDNLAIEKASNVNHQPKTRLAFTRLPNIFTREDVNREFGYNGNINNINSKLKRLRDDGLAQKICSGEDKGKYRKLA